MSRRCQIESIKPILNHPAQAPASTVVQPTPVHTGLTEDPQATLQRLFVSLVI